MMNESTTTFLDRVISKIFELPEPIRKLYVDALHDSIGAFASANQETQLIAAIPAELIFSPAQIEQKYQINLQDQLAYQVILKKQDAVEFLQEQGRSLSPKHDLKESKFTTAFKTRKPAKVGTALVFTYAEVLYLMAHRRSIVLPLKLRDLNG